MNVADLTLDGTDPMGDRVLEFSGFNPPHYAVYRTRKRMKIAYADDPDENARQRAATAALNPIRGEIVGLIDGWQTSANELEKEQKRPDPPASKLSPARRETSIKIKTEASETNVQGEEKSRSERKGQVVWHDPSTWWKAWRTHRAKRAERYNRRVGDTLIFALEGDVPGALVLLTKIRQEILDERTAWARFQYLIAAFILAVVAGGVVLMLYWLPELSTHPTEVDPKWWRVVWCGGAGAIGAFFSIALAICQRTILPDLQWLSNTMDATLRVLIGVLAAGNLEALVGINAVNVTLGDAIFKKDGLTLTVFLVGILAGFSERLVPDLLAQAGVKTLPPPTPPVPAPVVKSDARSVDKPAAELNPTTGSGQAAAEPVMNEDQDNHACEDDMVGNSATADADLPPASGGVVRAGGS